MKGIGKFLLGLVLGVAGFILVMAIVLPKQMFIEMESTKGFDETVEAIVQSAEEHNWTISHIYDLQASMKKKNFDVAPVKVFSLCNPDYAINILGIDKSRHISAVMPCRISVYEKEGRTYVSLMNARLISRFMPGKAKEAMVGAERENLKILGPVLK
jgi:uncharacterized protein (DUF302 family)